MRLLNKNPTKILLSILPLFYSCATVFNTPVQKVFLETDKNIQIISVNKSVSSDSSLASQPASKTYDVRRSNEPLIITIQIDSTQRYIALQPKNSPEYLMNILYNFGIGMLVEKNNVRRYEYQSRNYFTVTDTVIKRYRFSPTEKGTICFSFSLPFMLNHFTIRKLACNSPN